MRPIPHLAARLAAAGLLAMLPLTPQAQGLLEAAANFETGTAGQADHEDFSFYLMRDGTRQVRYGYGADRKEVELRYLGPRPGDRPGFAVAFPNRPELEIRILGDTLRARSADGRYDKTFRWRYEGPVDGRGTACTQCLDEDRAGAFLAERFAR